MSLAAIALFGLMLDAGAPDGVQAALVVRPWSWLRIEAGGGYNLVSPGARGAITLIPIDTVLRPTLTVEAGRYFGGDLSKVNMIVALGDSKETRVAYDWGSALLGIELDWGGGAFFIQGGVTKVLAKMTVPDVIEVMHANMLAPTAKLGFISWID